MEVALSTAVGPVELGLPGGRRLVAWTAGSLDDGLRVKAVTVNENGSAAGPEIDLGYEGSAIGRPAVALDATGQGALAFVESNGAGFQLVVTHVSCAAR